MDSLQLFCKEWKLERFCSAFSRNYRQNKAEKRKRLYSLEAVLSKLLRFFDLRNVDQMRCSNDSFWPRYAGCLLWTQAPQNKHSDLWMIYIEIPHRNGIKIIFLSSKNTNCSILKFYLFYHWFADRVNLVWNKHFSLQGWISSSSNPENFKNSIRRPPACRSREMWNIISLSHDCKMSCSWKPLQWKSNDIQIFSKVIPFNPLFRWRIAP